MRRHIGLRLRSTTAHAARLALALLAVLLAGGLPRAEMARAAATCVVANLNDSGAGSLRQCMVDVDTGGTITFAPGVIGTLTLTNGQLGTNRSMTIRGPGAGNVTISANGVGRVFSITGGAVAISDVTVADGKINGAGGILVSNTGTSLTLERAVVRDNVVTGTGGGIGAFNSATLVVTNSTFSGNAAGNGGAIRSFGAGVNVSVTGSTFDSNTATNTGGGIEAADGTTLTVTNSTFLRNTATNTGGGVAAFQGVATVVNSTFSLNTAAAGGGLNAQGGASSLTLANSTISGNSATRGGGLAAAFSSIVTATNTTFVDNGTSAGAQVSATGASITARNTIVAGAGSGCAGVTDGGHNLDSGSSCAFSAANGSQANTDPRLDPAGLADNGGPMRTIRLLGGSPAIDAGDNAVCAAAPIDGADQRGIARPQGARCDSGAYEVNPPNPVPTLTSIATNPAAVVAGAGGTVTLTLTGTGFAQDFSTVRINGQATINGGAIATTYVSPTQLTATLPAFPPGAHGDYAVTVVTSAPGGGTSGSRTLAVSRPPTSVTVTSRGPGSVSPGTGQYPYGPLTLTATPQPGALFTGWRVDGTVVGWDPTLTLTVSGPLTIEARFATRPIFSDVVPSGAQWDAITQLAARGIINGYGDGTYGPTDKVQRAQIAALIVRAMGWDGGTPGGPSPFSDLGGVDPELQRAIMILIQRGIAKGYDDGTFDPTGEVTHAQAISLIARSMVQAGYWTQVTAAEDDGTVYPNIPAASPHRLDLLTFVKYAGGIPDRPTNQAWQDWEGPASRGWTAQVLWPAINSYFKTNRVP